MLAPLGLLWAALASWRRRRLSPRSVRLPVAVIVVGNISVGGTGKTPLLLALGELLRRAGRRPGAVSRGYGGQLKAVQIVQPEDSPLLVGDEPLLLARAMPTAVGRDRVSAAQLLLAEDCDVILCDDGLQHYLLARDLEIAVIDGRRGLGNGHCLPAGPLREPPARLAEVDFVVVNGTEEQRQAWPGATGMRLQPLRWRRLDGQQLSLQQWRGGIAVHAVAGIGHPQRFFDTLRELGLQPLPHSFPDHHSYRAAELHFDDQLPVVMTEKDAVKCSHLSLDATRYWVLEVRAELEEDFQQRFVAAVQTCGVPT